MLADATGRDDCTLVRGGRHLLLLHLLVCETVHMRMQPGRSMQMCGSARAGAAQSRETPGSELFGFQGLACWLQGGRCPADCSAPTSWSSCGR
jgi:hypothetical protein